MKVVNLKIYSERLKAAREAKGMTQLELVYLSSVKNWKRGITNVNGLNLKKLSDILGVSEEYLAGYTDDDQFTEAGDKGLFAKNCNHTIDINTVKELVNKLVSDHNLSEGNQMVVDHALAIIEMTLKEGNVGHDRI